MSRDYLPVINRSGVSRVWTDDILYICREDRRISLATDSGVLVYYERMENVLPLLGGSFCFVLKGLAINMSRVNGIRGDTVTFDDGSTLMLSRDAGIRARRSFSRYLLTESEKRRAGRRKNAEGKT